MAGLILDQEDDVPEHLRWYFSHFLREISGSQEMAFGNADFYIKMVHSLLFIYLQCPLCLMFSAGTDWCAA